MAKKRGDADQCDYRITKADLLHKQNRNQSLRRIRYERQQAALFAEQASDVSRANIAAARFSDIQPR